MTLSEYTDIVTKVETFYNNAWGKLVLFGAIIFIIVGVVFPYIMQRIIRNQQKKDLRQNVRRFRRWVINQQKKSEDEINDKVDKRFAEKLEDLNLQMRKINHNGLAVSFHILGNYEFDKGEYRDALKSSIYASGYYFLGENYDGVNRMFGNINNNLEHLVYDDLIHLQDVENVSVFKLIKSFEEGKINNLYNSDIIKLKTIVHNMKTKKENPG